jgi:RNA-binding protein
VPQLRQADADTPEKEKGETENTDKLTIGKKRFVKRRLAEESPTIWIGKGGTSEELLKEIEKQLKKKKMIKVKILKTALGEDKAKQIASRIAQQTEASLVEVRGHTFMLYKPRAK